MRKTIARFSRSLLVCCVAADLGFAAPLSGQIPSNRASISQHDFLAEALTARALGAQRYFTGKGHGALDSEVIRRTPSDSRSLRRTSTEDITKALWAKRLPGWKQQINHTISQQRVTTKKQQRTNRPVRYSTRPTTEMVVEAMQSGLSHGRVAILFGSFADARQDTGSDIDCMLSRASSKAVWPRLLSYVRFRLAMRGHSLNDGSPYPLVTGPEGMIEHLSQIWASHEQKWIYVVSAGSVQKLQVRGVSMPEFLGSARKALTSGRAPLDEKRAPLDLWKNTIPGALAGVAISALASNAQLDIPGITIGPIFGALINYFAHELGHMLEARRQGVKFEVSWHWGVPHSVIPMSEVTSRFYMAGPATGMLFGLFVGVTGVFASDAYAISAAIAIIATNLFATLPMNGTDGIHLWKTREPFLGAA
jgi:hypothetical protein